MLGNCNRKKRKKYAEKDMENALKMCQKNNGGFATAAKTFNVPQTTLFTLYSKGATADTKLGRKPVLPPELEQRLVSYLLEMERRFFGMTRTDLKRLAFQLARCNDLPSPFNVNKEIAGE